MSSPRPLNPHPHVPHEVIPLWPDGSPNNGSNPEYRPQITITYPALWPPEAWDTEPRPRIPAILICPGGGYRIQARHEGLPFAHLFASRGIVGAVLTYRIAPDRYPAAFADATRAMRILRDRADHYAIDRERIGIMGFSAGGHLASTVATQWDHYVDPHDDLASTTSARPDRAILAYAVISMGAATHQGSRDSLLGPDADPSMYERLSNELHVGPETPPTFLFHTADDDAVPVRNCLDYAGACATHGVPFELHVHEHGPHGVGLANGHPALRPWPDALVRWLEPWTNPPAATGT